MLARTIGRSGYQHLLPPILIGKPQCVNNNIFAAFGYYFLKILKKFNSRCKRYTCINALVILKCLDADISPCIRYMP